MKWPASSSAQQNYSVIGRLNGKPAAIISVNQAAGQQRGETAAGVRKVMEDAKTRFPPDLDYVVALDTTAAVTSGIKEIEHTLLEAMVLVIIVVFLFLQSWRATLIPLLAVPVSLIGTFIVFPLLGFSINTLSLFGMVLAIGLVVDDAIVVVEAVEHHIEHGLTSARCHGQGDGGGFWPGHRYCFDPGRSVHSDRFYSRDHRPALSAICGDDCDLGTLLSLQCPDPQPCAFRDAFAAAGRSRADHWAHSSAGSIGCSAMRPTITSVLPGILSVRRSWRCASGCHCGGAPATWAKRFPPASFPMKIRDLPLLRYNCRSSVAAADVASLEGGRADPHAHARSQVCELGCGLQLVERRYHDLQLFFLCHL